LTQHGFTHLSTIRLRLAAFAILILGLAVAAHIDRNVPPPPPPADPAFLAAAPLDASDSKRAGYETGQLTGETGILAGRASQGVAGFFHGRPLALLIAVASFAAAGALVVAADKIRP
jgi:hypothetical protein